MKTIVICCDGTRNTFGNPDTNVRRVFDMLNDDDYYRYYATGLGTDRCEGALGRLSTMLSNLGGAGLALGQHKKVLDAYQFLCRYYEPKRKIFLFGFSRGAWCVRRLAKMISVVGLLPVGSEHLIPHAYHAYNKYKEQQNNIEQGGDQITNGVYDSFRKMKNQRSVDFIFIGVWDTVRSAGLQFGAKNCSLHNNGVTQMIGRHALALDERRRAFEPELWDPDPHVKQRWFPGDHSDVGGGNQWLPGSKKPKGDIITDDIDLSYLSLCWMCREANEFELGLPIEDILKKEKKVRNTLWNKRQSVNDQSTLWPLGVNTRRLFRRRTRRCLVPHTDYDKASIESRLEKLSPKEANQYREQKNLWARDSRR